MRAFSWLFGILIVGGLIVLFNSFYIVQQYQQALLLQFGDPVEVRNEPGSDEAGLHFKMPLVQNVVTLDRRNLGLDIPDIEILASDQERLVVDAFVRWRIKDPLKFYQRFRTEGGANLQLNRFTESAIRDALGKNESQEIISGQRSTLMNNIREAVNANVGDAGIDIIDVRIRRADLPAEISEQVFARMRTAREQEAERIRAEGDGESRRIRAEAERMRTVMLAEARQEAETIRGLGDGRRNDIYAQAFERDPDFFRFYRSLIACEEAIKEGTQVVVSPENLNLCKVFQEQASRATSSR